MPELKEIASPENLFLAYMKVRQRGGRAAGVDGMNVCDLDWFLQANGPALRCRDGRSTDFLLC